MRHARFKVLLFIISFLGFYSSRIYASFIESTMGLAVVNDATAAYYNPAALTLLKKSQFIALGSTARFNSTFDGSFTQVPTGFTLTGTATNSVKYFLPSFYIGVPIKDKVVAGVAIVSNFFNNEAEDTSLLRYVESNNHTKDIDLVPAIGVKLNDYWSIGANINFTYAKFIMQPIVGFPSLNIPDSQSHNESSSKSVGGDIGLLFVPNRKTQVGFNYRSMVAYRLSGTSSLNGVSHIVSDNYSFTFWTPARYVLSVSQLLTDKFGLIGTAQFIQWGIFKNLHIQGIAAQLGPQAAIINATVPYYLHNGWVFTLGSHYRPNAKWIFRLAGSFAQSPQNPNYQLSIGDNYIIGTSISYNFNENWLIDGGYSHGFIKNQNINIRNRRNLITGLNKASRDAISVKLILNV